MKIAVKAIGVNRADVFYRQGKYPYFGLELAGIGADGKNYAAVVNGGAYAAEVDAETFLELPKGMSFEAGASIIEGLFTAYYNLVELCGIKAGESVLIHGGAGSVGVVAIQLAKLFGANVFASAGKPEKLKLIESLGADAVDYRQGFGENKYDVILDCVGGSYFNANLAALKQGGRLAIIGFIGGAKTDANLAPLLLKNLSVFGSTISSQNKPELAKKVAPYFTQIKPIIDKTFAIADLDKALDYVEGYNNLGKVVVVT
jgi:NADPH2:quinone reductase